MQLGFLEKPTHYHSTFCVSDRGYWLCSTWCIAIAVLVSCFYFVQLLPFCSPVHSSLLRTRLLVGNSKSVVQSRVQILHSRNLVLLPLSTWNSARMLLYELDYKLGPVCCSKHDTNSSNITKVQKRTQRILWTQTRYGNTSGRTMQEGTKSVATDQIHKIKLKYIRLLLLRIQHTKQKELLEPIHLHILYPDRTWGRHMV